MMTQALKTSIILVLLFFSTGAFAQDAKFMSAFLYQFGRIMDFSTQSEGFVIGIYGESSVSDYLEKIAEIKKLNDQPIIVRKIGAPADAAGCQIVFIPGQASASLNEIREKIAGKGTLLVTENTDLINKGAGIAFVKVGNKILFELNKDNIAASGLKSSLSLERIAHKVY